MSSLIHTFPVGPLACNCTILADDSTGEAMVIDPGGDTRTILEYLKRHGLTLKMMLHTHAHFDHLLATQDLKRALGAPIYLHREDLALYQMVPIQMSMFGFAPVTPEPVDHFLEHGQVVSAGGFELQVLHTPGHSPGSICLHAKDRDLVFTGDTLFQQSIGRTDLWGGSQDQIFASISEKLLPLKDSTRLVPGHGPGSTIGSERAENPFLADL